MNIAVTIVTWNHETTIAEALESLDTQMKRAHCVVIVDNASRDDTVGVIERERAGRSLPVTLLRNPDNHGFAYAQNQAIDLARRADPDAILVMNPDVILARSTLEQLEKGSSRYPTFGSYGGKLLRPRKEGDQCSTIDSTGLILTRALHVMDRGANQQDSGQYDHDEEVFGHSGAFCLYRRDALEDLLAIGPMFPPFFFAYKEDADCAWRLQRRGWRSIYLADVEACHRRASAQPTRWATLYQQRRQRSVRVRRLSVVNDYAMIVRTTPLVMMILCLPWFMAREVTRWIYLIVMEPRVAMSFMSIIAHLPARFAERRHIARATRVKTRVLLNLLRLQ